MKLFATVGCTLSACLLYSIPKAEGRPPQTITIAGFKFSPAEMTVSRGDTIVWINDDAFLHTTTADSGAWASPELGRGARFMFVAQRAGHFRYHCDAHPAMRAIIVVK